MPLDCGSYIITKQKVLNDNGKEQKEICFDLRAKIQHLYLQLINENIKLIYMCKSTTISLYKAQKKNSSSNLCYK